MDVSSFAQTARLSIGIVVGRPHKKIGNDNMKTRYTVALSMLAGIAIGAVAIQSLHAQAKPKAYVISETEVLDAAALAAYSPLIRAATDAAGGRRLSPPGGKIVAFVGGASQARWHPGVGQPGESAGIPQLGCLQGPGSAA